MLVEFIGYPAAGKSTVEKMLLSLIEKRGGSILYRQDLVQKYIANTYFDKYPKTAFRKIFSAMHRTRIQCGSISLRNKLSLWRGLGTKRSFPFRWLQEDILLNAHILEQTQSITASMSEGFFHHLAAAYSWCGKEVLALHELAPHQTTLIHIMTDKDTALERLKRRGRPDSWPKDAGTNDMVMNNFSHAINEVLLKANKMNTTIYEVDWNGSLEQCETTIQQLASELRA